MVIVAPKRGRQKSKETKEIKDKPKFEITKVDEDICVRDAAKLLQVSETRLVSKINRFSMGYRREGAGYYRFLRKDELETLKQIFKRPEI